MTKEKVAKKSQNKKKSSPQTQGKNAPTPFLVNVRLIKDVEGAKKVLSKLIRGFVRNEISDPKARTLCYLLNSFVAICRDSDFEKRINALEEFLKNTREKN